MAMSVQHLGQTVIACQLLFKYSFIPGEESYWLWWALILVSPDSWAFFLFLVKCLKNKWQMSLKYVTDSHGPLYNVSLWFWWSPHFSFSTSSSLLHVEVFTYPMKYLNIYLMDEESNIVQTQQLDNNYEINCH